MKQRFLKRSNKAAINRGNATLFEIVLLPLHRTPIIHTMKVKAENWLNVCACLAAVCSGTKTCTFIINRMKKPNLCCDNGRRKHRKLNSLHLLPCNYLCHWLNVKIMLKDLFLKNDPAQWCEYPFFVQKLQRNHFGAKHDVWKSQKKSHSTSQWRLRSNSVTDKVNFKRKKIGTKCQNWKLLMRHLGDFQTLWPKWSFAYRL